MKKITSTILLSLSITGGVFTSCDIDRFPNNYMATDQVADNQEVLFDNMLNGMYAQLKTWSDPMHRLGEYAGDNMMIRGASTDAFSNSSLTHAPQITTVCRTSGTMDTKPLHRPQISLTWPKIQMTRKLKAN